MSDKLSQTLTTFRGTAILLNIVIGAGLLTLPGLAIKEAGSNAIYSWLICALAAAPLLAVFVILGRQYPDAGGVAAYAQRALGTFGRRSAAFLLLGAVIFGLPSIALTGGHYLASVFPGSAFFYGTMLLIGSVIPNFFSGDRAGKLMAFLASGVLVSIVAFLLIGLFSMDPNTTTFAEKAIDWSRAFEPFTMLFFAFTGWEIGAGIAEEFVNPRRDFPLSMGLSFVIVTGLYLAVAFVASRSDLNGHWEAPFVVFVGPVLGSYGATGVALIAAIIVFANLAGAIWGVSRLIFSLGRDAILPKALAVTRNGTPLRAIVTTFVALLSVLFFYRTGTLSLEAMIGIAGQNFLILYGLAAVSLFVLAKKLPIRLLSASVVAVVVGLLSLQGLKLIYPIGLIGIAACIDFLSYSPTQPTNPPVPDQ